MTTLVATIESTSLSDEPISKELESALLETESSTYKVVDQTDYEDPIVFALRLLLKMSDPKKNVNHDLADTYEIVHITEETVQIAEEIENMLQELQGTGSPVDITENHPIGYAIEGQTESFQTDSKELPKKQEVKNQPPAQEKKFSSLFSLARSFNSTLAAKQMAKKEPVHETSKPRETPIERHELHTFRRTEITDRQSHTVFYAEKKDEQLILQDKNLGKDEERRQGKDQQEQKQQQQQEEKKSAKKKRVLGIVQTSRRSNSFLSPKADYSEGEEISEETRKEETPSIDNIYMRFLALMARILGQAEYEGHQLYLRIKERTDNVDTLTHLLSKINMEKKGIDWTKNEEMKALIDKAREIGVQINPGQLKWSEDEKRLLKENIQMRKDSMEKITQLERTDMQRYLQEASQCHQARSNILKMLKEVTDTLIHNMRPG